MYRSVLFLLLFIGCNEKKINENSEIPKISTNIEKAEIITPLNEKKGEIIGTFYGCGYNYILNKSNLAISSPLPREINQVETILNFTGLYQNFELYSAPIENAVATIINNKRVIVYDPRLFNFADTNSNSFWSSMSIIAHEIGHHLQGHTLERGGSSPEKELEADKFSGHILFKMGASLEQATSAMRQFGSENDTQTHPSKYKRIKAISLGWNSSADQRYDSAIPPPPSDENKFERNSYAKDEFFADELIPKEYKQYYLINGDEPLIEGIILDSKYSQNEGDLSLHLIVTNDKNAKGYDKEVFKKGKKVNLFIPKVGNGEIGTADLSWLEELLVPGRKISFKPNSFGLGASGNGSWSIIYIKKQNR